MSIEKHEQLVKSGQLNPDGTRKDAPPPANESDAVAEPEAVQVGVKPTT